MLKLGYCQYELKQLPQASATFNRIIATYPGSEEARLAADRLHVIQLQSAAPSGG